MCGICGKFYKEKTTNADSLLMSGMCERMHHRGPDEKNVIRVPSGAGMLGASRLKIIDLHGGRQPMMDKKKEIFVCMNGEIYNYVELRNQLAQKGYEFSTQSDTEVIVHLYREKKEAFVHDLIGMFAISIWDECEKKLILVRDRMGKKPLVYTCHDGNIVFASELNALLCDKDIPRDLSEEAVWLYFTYNFIPSPYTVYKHASKLPAAHMMIWKNGETTLKKYWNVCSHGEVLDTPEAAREKLFFLIEDAVRIRLRSDVKVGAFLSGGMDSSALAFFTHTLSPSMTFFTLSFKDKSYDEFPFAAKVAETFGLQHVHLLAEDTLFDNLERVLQYLGEPFGDSSLLPTFYLCKEAGRHATVCLSGDGGDEVFWGYTKYSDALKKIHLSGLWQAAKNFFLFAGAGFKEKYFYHEAVRYLNQTVMNNGAHYLDKISFFNAMEKMFLFTENLRKSVQQLNDPLWHAFSSPESSSFLEKIIDMEMSVTLPDSLMEKVDIASMANSMEVRSPLCDHRIVEYVHALPSGYKINKKGEGKVLLRDMMRGVLPEAILRKPKKGFTMPLNEWLKKKLHSVLAEAVHDPEMRNLGYFNMEYLQSIFRLHGEGRIQRGRSLYAFLVFYLWHRNLRKAGVP